VAQFTQSRAKGKSQKPKKPYVDFPLFAHATGRWAKKIRGKFVYFGPWSDPDAALEKYLAEKDYLQAGKTPPVVRDGLTVKDLCNRFLTSKKRLLDNSELSPRSFKDYVSTCDRMLRNSSFRFDPLVEDLVADDFAKLREKLSSTLGPVALGNEVQRIRTIFKYGFETGLLDKPVRFGPEFKKPSRKVIRQVRNANGPRMFEADELRIIVEAAKHPLKAMIYLGINCGFGQSDIGSLPMSAIDLEQGWIDYPRPKTAVMRRIPLWPETVEAIRDAIQVRKTHADKADSDISFITSHGKRWARTSKTGSPIDNVSKEFTKLLKRLNLKRDKVNFYALRHTFETIGGESRDQVATNAIMGHVDQSMAGAYRERISDERLRNVVDVVHNWLFGDGN